MQVRLTGVSFGDCQQTLKSLMIKLATFREKPLVYLKRERDNPYDDNAVAVMVNLNGEKKIGYIPRASNSYLADYLDNGGKVDVFDIQVFGGYAGKNFGCIIHIKKHLVV